MCAWEITVQRRPGSGGVGVIFQNHPSLGLWVKTQVLLSVFIFIEVKHSLMQRFYINGSIIKH